jgi:hypothetical protein
VPVAQPARRRIYVAERQAQAATAIAVARLRRRAAPAASVVVRRVVVIAEAEEPDQPDDQQADVEHAQPDHEDPPLRGHSGDGTRAGRQVKRRGPGAALDARILCDMQVKRSATPGAPPMPRLHASDPARGQHAAARGRPGYL